MFHTLLIVGAVGVAGLICFVGLFFHARMERRFGKPQVVSAAPVNQGNAYRGG
jgi:hypothetical protein